MIAALVRFLGLVLALAETQEAARAAHCDDVQYHFTIDGGGAGACTVVVWTNGDPRALPNVDYLSVFVNEDDDPACAVVTAETIRANVTRINSTAE